MGRSEADDMILSHGDVVLRRSDLKILGGPNFLNDRIIEFCFSYLSSTQPSQDILLVPPSIAFWMANCLDPESLGQFIEPLRLKDKKLVIFPVNDNDDVNLAEGGNHWSLLAYYRKANVFVHHDSAGLLNRSQALQLYNAIAGLVSDFDCAARPKYMDFTDSPRQVNGYDCGLYVTATARAIYRWYQSHEEKDEDGLWFSAVKEEVTPSAVSGMRKEILELITGLMAGK